MIAHASEILAGSTLTHVQCASPGFQRRSEIYETFISTKKRNKSASRTKVKARKKASSLRTRLGTDTMGPVAMQRGDKALPAFLYDCYESANNNARVRLRSDFCLSSVFNGNINSDKTKKVVNAKAFPGERRFLSIGQLSHFRP